MTTSRPRHRTYPGSYLATPPETGRERVAYLLLMAALLLMTSRCVGATDGIVNIDLSHSVATVIPDQALGAALDGYEAGDVAKIYTKPNIKAMTSAGFRTITYRLRTELGVEAWHWNPRGRWSDPRSQSGYWTSSAKPSREIQTCYGYRLPRRGNTFDQANNDGYSRIDDGDVQTYWKSNPYLSPPFTSEEHPQWILIALPKPASIDTLRIVWAIPYAVRYRVDYWDDPNGGATRGIESTIMGETHWRTFQDGEIEHAAGGQALLRLAPTPVRTQFVRITLLASSFKSIGFHLPHYWGPGGHDIRDRLGYAIREIYIGQSDAHGHFVDAMRHGRTTGTQTAIYVSSTDPWHRISDRDPNVEQPGYDRLFRCGITQGNPVMVPVGLAYDTSENAVAEIRYLRARGYPINRVEMGEEPDGQFMTPEDYGALFIQWATALHRFDPTLQLGGPCYQTIAVDERAWPDSPALGRRALEGGVNSPSLGRRGSGGGDDVSWTHRFIRYLQSHGHLKDLAFFSFECYFYDDVCGPAAPKLLRMPELIDAAFDRWRRDGVPTTIPWLATEYGYSAYSSPVEVDLPGALMDADLTAHFLTIVGSGIYFYGLEPNSLIQESTRCQAWGNLTLWLADDDRHIIAPVAARYALQLVTQDWLQPGKAHVVLYRTNTNIKNSFGQPLVTAYAAHRPDGRWSVLLINKDPDRSYRVRLSPLAPNNGGTGTDWVNGLVDLFQYSSRQYVWHPNGADGHASPNLPPSHIVLAASENTAYLLPPYSITVIRGTIRATTAGGKSHGGRERAANGGSSLSGHANGVKRSTKTISAPASAAVQRGLAVRQPRAADHNSSQPREYMKKG